MNQNQKQGCAFGRVFAGAVAGSIFGFFTELALSIFLWEMPAGEGKIPLVGPAVGASLGGAFGHLFGGKAIRGWMRICAILVLVGTLAGILSGYLVFAPIMTANDPFADELFRGRVQARYQKLGVICGAALGALCGLLVAVIIYYHGSGRRG